MKPDAVVGTQVGGIYAQLYSNGQTASQVMPDAKMIMPFADLPLGERLYSAATIRKWLEDESPLAQMWWRTDIGPEEIYRQVIAAKLQELEGGE